MLQEIVNTWRSSPAAARFSPKEQLMTIIDPDPILLTTQQAADRLGIGRCTAQALINSGELRSFKIGKLRRVPVSAIQEFIATKLGEAA